MSPEKLAKLVQTLISKVTIPLQNCLGYTDSPTQNFPFELGQFANTTMADAMSIASAVAMNVSYDCLNGVASGPYLVGTTTTVDVDESGNITVNVGYTPVSLADYEAM